MRMDWLSCVSDNLHHLREATVHHRYCLAEAFILSEAQLFSLTFFLETNTFRCQFIPESWALVLEEQSGGRKGTRSTRQRYSFTIHRKFQEVEEQGEKEWDWPCFQKSEDCDPSAFAPECEEFQENKHLSWGRGNWRRVDPLCICRWSKPHEQMFPVHREKREPQNPRRVQHNGLWHFACGAQAVHANDTNSWTRPDQHNLRVQTWNNYLVFAFFGVQRRTAGLSDRKGNCSECHLNFSKQSKLCLRPTRENFCRRPMLFKQNK